MGEDRLELAQLVGRRDRPVYVQSCKKGAIMTSDGV